MRDSFDPFNAAIIGLFSWTAYLDGSIWASGACGGVAAIMFLDFLQAWASAPRS